MDRRRTTRNALAWPLSLAFLGLLAFGLTRSPQDLPSALIDRAAPDFALQSLDDGRTVRLSKRRGSVVVLNFWASWCLACRDEHAALSSSADRHRDKGVHFYGVLYQDTPENARRWIREMGGQSYPTLLDPGTRTAIDLGVYGVPETLFIDRAGRVAHKHIGPVTEAVLSRRIGMLLATPDERSGGDGRGGMDARHIPNRAEAPDAPGNAEAEP